MTMINHTFLSSPFDSHAYVFRGLTDGLNNGTATSDTLSTLQWSHAVFSGFSLAASSLLILSYLRFPNLRQHPSSLVFWRSIFDSIFSIHFILLFSLSNAADHCNVFAFFFQFSVLGSQSWYLLMSLDLYRALTNPFTSLSASLPWYHAFVWITSFATAAVIIGSHSAAYRTNLDICWTAESSHSLNALNWAVFYVPTLIYYVIAIGVLIYAAWRLRNGVQATFKTRTRVLYNGARYVAAFSLYWTFAGVIYFLIFLDEKENSTNSPTDSSPIIYVAFAVTLAIRALVDDAVWFYNNSVWSTYKAWWNGQSLGADDTVSTDINHALRRELLMATTTAICESIAMCRSSNPHVHTLLDTSAEAFTSSSSSSASSSSSSQDQRRRGRDRTHARPTTAATKAVNGDAYVRMPHDSGDNDNVNDNDNDNDIQVDVNGDDGDDRNVSTSSSSSQRRTNEHISALALSRLIPPSLHAPSDGLALRKMLVSRVDNDDSPIPFTDFAPCVFSALRCMWGIDDDAYARSIKGDTESMIEKFTEGRSASFFYFSEDGQYLVKTLTHEEASVFTTLLPAYFRYMRAHPDSLLNKFVGLHSIRLYRVTMYFVVMQSVFRTPLKIDERYDLKGSWIDRHTSRPVGSSLGGGGGHSKRRGVGYKKASGGGGGGVMKDNDFNHRIVLSEEERTLLLRQLERDTLFLASWNIMDYSLLLGIHRTQHVVGVETDLQLRSSAEASSSSASAGAGAGVDASAGAAGVHPTLTRFQQDAGGLRARVIEGPAVYFFGLIDMLQMYNADKRMERFFKTRILCKDRDGISAVPPKLYRSRFLAAMRRITVSTEMCMAERSALSTAAASVGANSSHHGQSVPAALLSTISNALSIFKPSSDDSGGSANELTGSPSLASNSAPSLSADMLPAPPPIASSNPIAVAMSAVVTTTSAVLLPRSLGGSGSGGASRRGSSSKSPQRGHSSSSSLSSSSASSQAERESTDNELAKPLLNLI